MSNLGQQRLTASHKGIGGEAWSLKPQRSRSGRGVCQTCLEPGSRKEDSRPKPQLKHQVSLCTRFSNVWLAVATCPQLRDAQTPPVFREAAAAIIRHIIVTELQHFGNEVETEDPRDTLTLTLSETAQPRSSSVVSNTSTALMADK